MKNMKGVVHDRKLFGVAKDFTLNILSSVIITVITQIVVYPWMGRTFDPVLYGVILTIMGIGNTLVNTIGGSINNARLLMQSDYQKENETGDFNFILLVCSIASIGIFFLYYASSKIEFSNETIVFLVLYLILGSIRGYAVVIYRIVLDFIKNLVCSIAIAVGNLAGILFVIVTKKPSYWPLVFVFGEVFGILVLLLNSDIFKEPFRITPLFRRTVSKVSILIVTTLIASALLYLDRILLLPILGGEAVSTYTTASFFGKCLGIVLTPIASVLLGYYSQKGFSMSRKLFRIINVAVMASALFFFGVSLVLSRWFTGLLYPSLIDAAVPYLMIANLTAIIGAVGNMTQPAILKFAPTHLQIYIQLIYCAIYLGGGYFASTKYGIGGFAIAALIATIARLLALYILGEVFIHGKN